MKSEVIVLSVNRYSLVDKATGELNEGTSVRYVATDNLNPYEEGDLKGYKPAKSKLDYLSFQDFPEVPAIYDADFTISVASDGNAKAVADKFVLKRSLFPKSAGK